MACHTIGLLSEFDPIKGILSGISSAGKSHLIIDAIIVKELTLLPSNWERRSRLMFGREVYPSGTLPRRGFYLVDDIYFIP